MTNTENPLSYRGQMAYEMRTIEKKFLSPHSALQEKLVFAPYRVPRTIQELNEWYDVTSEINTRVSEAVTNSILSTTPGAGFASLPSKNLVLVQTGKPAFMRNTAIVEYLGQGQGTLAINPLGVPTSASLSEDTEPTLVGPTIYGQNVAIAPRGGEMQLSLEADRKIAGITPTSILALRQSEVYDEDIVCFGSATGGFESVTTTNLAGVSFPSGITSESQITSTNINTAAQMLNAIQTLVSAGIDVSQMVAVKSETVL